jgi:hypothetical protein
VYKRKLICEHLCHRSSSGNNQQSVRRNSYDLCPKSVFPLFAWIFILQESYPTNPRFILGQEFGWLPNRCHDIPKLSTDATK